MSKNRESSYEEIGIMRKLKEELQTPYLELDIKKRIIKRTKQQLIFRKQ